MAFEHYYIRKIDFKITNKQMKTSNNSHVISEINVHMHS